MLKGAYLLENPGTIDGFFDIFLGGLFRIDGIPFFLKLGCVLSFCTALLCALIEHRSGDRRWGVASRLASYFLLFTEFILLFSPWDELFINLRHSYHLATAGFFSFNLHQPIEATVDFLPYFLIGVLAKTGLPIPEMAFAMSLIGAFICVSAGRKLLGLGEKDALGTFALCTFPSIAINSSSGFTATLFASALLWSIYYCALAERLVIGAVILSLIPLIRLEGAWAVFLIGAVLRYQGRITRKQAILFGMGVFSPILLLSLWRWKIFGSPIPVPITFKSALGNPFFLTLGFRNFFADFVAANGHLWLGVLAVGYYRRRNWEDRNLLPFAGALFLFVVPYYFSGGDWFPFAWGRYLLPFSLFIFVMALREFPKMMALEKGRSFCVGGFIAIAFFSAMTPFHGIHKMVENLFLTRATLARLSISYTNLLHYRVQYLSQVGNHLNQTSREDQIIASSELATVMYFAKREGLDFLGLASPEIAAQPLRRTPRLIRIKPKESELPRLIFKRLKPEILAREMPPFLVTFDFIPGVYIKDLPEEEWGPCEYRKALQRWEKKFETLIEPLYGGFENIERLGYTPVLARYDNDFTGLYFVSASARDEHFRRSIEAGFAPPVWINLEASGLSATCLGR